VLAVLTNLVDHRTGVVTLWAEVTDENLDVFLLLDDALSDFLNQVGVSTTNFIGGTPSNLGVDVSFLGGVDEFVDEGSVDLIVTAEEGGESSLLIEFVEWAGSGHAEDDFGDVEMMAVVDIHMMDASAGPFHS